MFKRAFPAKDRATPGRHRASHLLLAGLLLVEANSIAASEMFEDVTRSAGVSLVGPTAASAWGDANGDGWLDLWVSNHHGLAPTLLLNRGQGKFDSLVPNLTPTPSPGTAWPDFHGALWNDFDNDGDQDLFVTTGAGAGRGSSANRLYQNDGNLRFNDIAPRLGLDYPLGRGRTPLWFDADGNGRLDLLLMNKPRKEAPSTLMLQNDDGSFTDRQGVPERSPSWWEALQTRVSGWFADPSPMVASNEFAQLARFDGAGKLALVTYGRPVTIRQGYDGAFEPGTAPDGPRAIQDAAIADFDGDGLDDWLLIRSFPWMREIRQPDARRLEAVLNGSTDDVVGIDIETAGDLTVTFHPPWMDPSDPRANRPLKLVRGSSPSQIAIGRAGFRAGDPELHASPTAEQLATEGALAVHFDPATSVWTVQNSLGAMNLEVTSSAPIERWAAQGFDSGDGAGVSRLLLQRDGEFKSTDLPRAACQSVSAADFDNDGDVDAFLVCATPSRDAADLLLLNDGTGAFTTVEMPAQAAGRGNQVAAADFDNDGFVDLAITNGAGPPPFADRGRLQLLRNRGNANHWLQLILVGQRSNRDGVGATVTLTAGGRTQHRHQGGGAHSFSQDQQRIHFGIGSQTQIERVTINWPSGVRQTLEQPAIDQLLTVREPERSSAP